MRTLALTVLLLGVGASWAAEPMSVDDFLLDMNQLEGRIVAVHGEAICDSPDLCVLYRGAWKNFAFDTSGLPRETRRKLLNCIDYRCPMTVIGRVQAGPNIGPLLIANQIEW